jgi:predicted 3-demethylubiquinone-9 3-methyltransferase (glyoxalase superfamily)
MSKPTPSGKPTMKPITPCLWFDDKAEEAMKFYVSAFPGSKILNISHYGDAGPLPKGMVMTVTCELNGQPFMALNGGPNFKFSPAVSFVVYCRSQAEIDKYWEKLSKGGEKGVCGWLTDRYGLSWQIVPTVLEDMVSDSDPGRSSRVMSALMQMKKLDIVGLKQAYAQRSK